MMSKRIDELCRKGRLKITLPSSYRNSVIDFLQSYTKPEFLLSGDGKIFLRTMMMVDRVAIELTGAPESEGEDAMSASDLSVEILKYLGTVAKMKTNDQGEVISFVRYEYSKVAAPGTD